MTAAGTFKGLSYVDGDRLAGYIPCDCHTWMPWLWDYLRARFKPRSMLDVGAGEARAARYFLDRGVEAWAIDGSPVAREAAVVPPDRYILHDFEKDSQRVLLDSTACAFDLIWSCEFVEHVEERFACNFLAIFARAKVVAMTHAIPEQEGHHHVNCQPAEYWIERMADYNFKLDRTGTEFSRNLCRDYHKVDTYWTSNGLLFIKR